LLIFTENVRTLDAATGETLMPKEGNRTERVELRLEPKEKEAFVMAADASGLSLSSWIRERLRRAARQDLEEAGERVPFKAGR
jgi:uncharacterized protein (DUF1778 family)